MSLVRETVARFRDLFRGCDCKIGVGIAAALIYHLWNISLFLMSASIVGGRRRRHVPSQATALQRSVARGLSVRQFIAIRDMLITKGHLFHGHDYETSNNQIHDADNEALDSAVYKKLRIGCELPEEIESCIPFQWRNQETLAGFVERVYEPSPESGSVQPIDINNVRAKVLRKRASIKIRPTDILSGHLYLHIGKRFKILYPFSDRGFLEESLSGLCISNQAPTHSTTEALGRGCLPPLLMMETLATLNLLFPSVNDPRSHRFSKRWVHRHAPEEHRKSLLEPSRQWSTLGYDDPPKRLRELYQRYPYWAPQLSLLLEEVREPTPVNWWGTHVKRNLSEANMYKCAVAALIVAAISGTLATVLAAVQVWISYCDWEKDGKPRC
ncbi:hypothetical protein CGLO_03016 [Colletotrichum gloeosporioides Cg-14]|uniref:Uncharacterized protein n=1 Tax=Colletotrichum gloeosporioides (strain Cg-14) TaxID=1237896 RepID=T0KWZ8_COLGC|nr:hypothetical protein CGLO_03016 [Colletotrichum gloeosporioides Cg-14]